MLGSVLTSYPEVAISPFTRAATTGLSFKTRTVRGETHL